MSSQQQTLITASVDGIPLGIFDTRTGGVSAAEVGKYRPGGMAREKTRAGLPSAEDVTITRENEPDRDNDLVRHLRTRAGRAPMTVTEQPLDDNGAPWGKPTTWTGRLQSADGGDADSGSTDGRLVTLVMVVAEVV